MTMTPGNPPLPAQAHNRSPADQEPRFPDEQGPFYRSARRTGSSCPSEPFRHPHLTRYTRKAELSVIGKTGYHDVCNVQLEANTALDGIDKQRFNAQVFIGRASTAFGSSSSRRLVQPGGSPSLRHPLGLFGCCLYRTVTRIGIMPRIYRA